MSEDDVKFIVPIRQFPLLVHPVGGTRPQGKIWPPSNVSCCSCVSEAMQVTTFQGGIGFSLYTDMTNLHQNCSKPFSYMLISFFFTNTLFQRVDLSFSTAGLKSSTFLTAKHPLKVKVLQNTRKLHGGSIIFRTLE